MRSAVPESGRPAFRWPESLRPAWLLLLLCCSVYLLGFALFYPRLAVNDDEAQYIRQASLLLRGTATIELADARTGEAQTVRPSTYPLGTAALMSPFVAAAGWRGAFLLAPLSFVGAVLLLARWLRDAGRPPIFALLLLSFVPALVMGRVAMSDIPSAAIATLGLWLFWQGMRRRPAWWLGAGFVAGASAALRPTNVLVFAPFFVGAVLRRDRNWWALAAGGVFGVSLRLISSAFVLGDAFADRASYVFEPQTLMERLPLYLLGLFVLLPGGLPLSLLYRGERRAEVISTIAFFVGFFLLQTYSTKETSSAKRIVLALRYFLPILPLMIFAMSESIPRLWTAWRTGLSDGARVRLDRLAKLAMVGWIVVTCVASLGVHGFMQRWAKAQAEIHDAILEHARGSVLVTNLPGTKKFIPVLELTYQPVDRDSIQPTEIVDLAERHGRVVVALLDRSDSAWWRTQSEANARFIAAVQPEPALLLDLAPTATDRLRIWRVDRSETER